jgi:uncharacterized DUF497 family protein
MQLTAKNSGTQRSGLTEEWTVLFVVHLLREADTIRIISARPATALERRAYEDGA